MPITDKNQELRVGAALQILEMASSYARYRADGDSACPIKPEVVEAANETLLRILAG